MKMTRSTHIYCIYVRIFFVLGVEFELSPNDVTPPDRVQIAVAASNDVTQILVVPVETDLHFSSQRLARFWLLGCLNKSLLHLDAFARTHEHTYIFTHTDS